MSGHVCQRGKKDQWYAVIDVYEDGKRKRRWHRLEGATGKREAEKACEKLIAQQGDGLYVAPNKQTFQQYFEAWATDWLPMQVGPSTRESYANWGKHLIAAFGAKPIQQIRGGDLNRAYGLTSPQPPKDCRPVQSSLSMFWRGGCSVTPCGKATSNVTHAMRSMRQRSRRKRQRYCAPKKYR